MTSDETRDRAIAKASRLAREDGMAAFNIYHFRTTTLIETYKAKADALAALAGHAPTGRPAETFVLLDDGNFAALPGGSVNMEAAE